MIRELTDQGAEVAREHYGAARLGLPPEHRPVARGRADGRAELGHVHHRRRLALHAPLGALPLHRRQGVPAGVLPGPEGRGASSSWTSWSSIPTHGWLVTNPVHLARELPGRPGNDTFFDEVTSFMTRHLDLRRLDDRHADPPRPVRRVRRGGRRARRRPGLQRAGPRRPRAGWPRCRSASKGNLQEWLEDWDETREEPPAHLAPVRPLSRRPDLGAADAGAGRGGRGRPRPARARRATGWAWPGRRPAGRAWGTRPRRWRTSPTRSRTTRPRASSRSAPGPCRWTARSA